MKLFAEVSRARRRPPELEEVEEVRRGLEVPANACILGFGEVFFFVALFFFLVARFAF